MQLMIFGAFGQIHRVLKNSTILYEFDQRPQRSLIAQPTGGGFLNIEEKVPKSFMNGPEGKN